MEHNYYSTICPQYTNAFKWTEELTKKFIQLRHEREKEFTGKRNASIIAWGKIIKQLGLQNVVTVTQAKKKWINMVKKYKELKNPPIASGMEDGISTPMTWPYYEAMDKVLGEQATIYSPLYVSSSSGVIIKNECQQENNTELISKSSNSISSDNTSIEEPPLKKRKLTELVINAIEENNKKSDELITVIKELGDRMLYLFEKLLEKF